MKHTIYVDDDQHVRRAVARVLSRFPDKSVTHHDPGTPEAALELAAKLLQEEGSELELVLLTDGNMVPFHSMDGDELIRRMRELLGPCLNSAVMCTGRTTEWVASSQELGFDLESKPVDRARLYAILREKFDIPDDSST